MRYCFKADIRESLVSCSVPPMISTETIWLAVGFLGQGLFFGRWLVQWIASERHAASQVPVAFWYMSVIGGLITLVYAIYRRDPVFIIGQTVGVVVYVRNLALLRRASADGKPSPFTGVQR